MPSLSWFLRPRARRPVVSRRCFFRPMVEMLERRDLMATVTSLGDSLSPTPGMLRYEIATASFGDTITFDIDPAGSSVVTIRLLGALPTLSGITLDGTTEKTGRGATVELTKAAIAGSFDGLILSDHSIVQGLIIDGFTGNGIFVGGQLNVIGGTTPAERNVISGNIGDGVHIEGSGATDNLVRGNFIGIASDGATPQGNIFGVSLNGSSFMGGTNNQVLGNVISSNSTLGVYVGPSERGDTLDSNLIGTDASGTLARGNGEDGIELEGATNISIGDVGAGNVIADSGVGITLTGGSGNLIQGNFIGTDASGLRPLGNAFGGIFLNNSNGNVIGGSAAGQGNVIAGNGVSGGDGILINNEGSFNNTVQGNFIGLNAAGAALGNTGAGIDVVGSSDNTIGGSLPGEGNVIAGNTGDGVLLNGSYSNLLQGNFIGTDASRLLALPNGGVGVNLVSSGDNTIGGTMPGEGNVIADNTGVGIRVDTGVGNQLLGNAIFANMGGGIVLENGGNNNQPAPVITGVALTGNTVTISWTLDIDPQEVIDFGTISRHIEFFSNTVADSMGLGQGQRYLGSFTAVFSNMSGHAQGDFPYLLSDLSQLVFTATATAFTPPDTSMFSNAVPLPTADLAVAVIVDDPTPREGQTVTYTIQIVNNGPDAASGIQVGARLPSGVAFANAALGQGSYDPLTGIWSVGGLAVGASAMLRLRGVVQPGTSGTVIVDTVTILGSTPFDFNSLNDTASVAIAPRPPDLPAPPADIVAAIATIVPVVPPPFVPGDGIPPASLIQVLGTSNTRSRQGFDFFLDIDLPRLAVINSIATLTLTAPSATAEFGFRPPTSRANSSGSIMGTIFEDTNGDGLRQIDEVPLEGMGVFLDVGNTGEFDGTQPMSLTDSNGQFHFEGLAPGTYKVRVVTHHFFAVSAPEKKIHEVTVAADGSVSVVFGCKPLRPRSVVNVRPEAPRPPRLPSEGEAPNRDRPGPDEAAEPPPE